MQPRPVSPGSAEAASPSPSAETPSLDPMAPPASSWPLPRLITAAGLTLLAALTLNVNSTTRIYTWPWWLVHRAMLLLPLVLLLLDAWRPASRGRFPRLPAALLLVFAGMHGLSAALSIDPVTSAGAAFTTISMCALVAVIARSPAALQAAPLALAIAGIAYCGASVIAWLMLQVLPHWQHIDALNAAAGAEIFAKLPWGPRNSLLFGHWNYTAGFGVLALPWALAFAWRARGARRALWSGGAALVALAIFSATSRASIPALAAAAAFAIAAAIFHARWPLRRAALLVALAAVALAAATLVSPRIRQTAAGLLTGQGRSESDVQRLSMITVGGMMFRDHWLLGQGPGLTPRLYPAYRARVDGGVESAFQIHSSPVQIAVDAGAAGLAAGALLVATALGACLLELRRGSKTDGESGIPAWARAAAGVSLAGYTVYALTDHQLDVPLIAAAVAGCFAILFAPAGSDDGCATADAPHARGARLALGIVAALALIGGLVTAAPEAIARRSLDAAMTQFQRTADTTALDEVAARATGLLPRNPHYLVGAAMAHLRAAFRPEAQPAAVEQHLAAARTHLTRALAVEPRLDVAHFNLGWLELSRQPAAAAGHFRASVRLSPDRSGVYFGLGLARLSTGDAERGVTALALELLQDPRFAVSPAWDVSALQPHRESALRRAIAIAQELESQAAPADRATIAYSAALFSWLLGEAAADRVSALAPASAQPYFGAAPAPAGVAAPEITTKTAGWEALAQATRAASAEERRAVLARFVHSRAQRAATGEEMHALALLVSKHGADARGWLTAPEGRDAPFARIYHKNRPGYAMLAYNLDLPLPQDAYFAQDNGLVDWFFADLFPTRGHLPDSLLVAHVESRDL